MPGWLLGQYVGVVAFFTFLACFLAPGDVTFDAHQSRTDYHFDACHSQPRFRHFVLIVIDALRYDFATGPLGNFSALLTDHGVPFHLVTAVSRPPTVTLPRLKSLLTGAVPSFVDVLVNLNSAQLHQDNIIARLVAKGNRVVFYGDDTWLKLFPTAFVRWEGTTSFFVQDFYEVDSNVSRHVTPELTAGRSTWDVLILHYLGLDHIGHVYGPSSALVAPKLAEMAHVVANVTRLLRATNESFLLTVCGDHGMADQGGHGGSSRSEMLTPLYVISNHITETSVFDQRPLEQTDFAPTAALLFELPVPRDSVGVAMVSALNALGVGCVNAVVRATAQLILRRAQSMPTLADDTALRRLHNLLQTAQHNVDPATLSQSYHDDLLAAVYDVQERLILSKADHDTPALFVAVVVCCLATLMLLCVSHDIDWGRIFSTLKNIPFYYLLTVIVFKLFVDFILIPNSSLSTARLLLSIYHPSLSSLMSHVTITAAVVVVMILCSSPWRCSVEWTLLAVAMFVAASQFSSSLVEEQQYVWFFALQSFLIGWLAAIWLSRRPLSANSHVLIVTFEICAVLMLVRLSWLWNRTGIKWAHLEDISDWLNEQSSDIRLAVAGLAIVVSTALVFPRRKARTWDWCVLLATVSLQLWYRHLVTVAQQRPVLVARLILLAVAATAGAACWRRSLPWLLHACNQLALLLSADANLGLVLLSRLHTRLLDHAFSTAPSAAEFLITFASGWFYFFAQGNSNSVSTVNIAVGYTVLTTYDPTVIGLLVFYNTYAQPIWWFLSRLTRLDGGQQRSQWALRWAALEQVPSALYLVNCVLQRHHLFVWSVFAPRLLYQAAALLATAAWSTLVVLSDWR